MEFALYIDGKQQDNNWVDQQAMRIQIEQFDVPEYRCANCGEPMAEAANGSFEDHDQCTEPEPERVPLAWANSAGIIADEGEDSLTVTLSVGDPRGAFAFTIRRTPTGELMLYLPHPTDSAPHMPLTEVRPGAYRIGRH